MATFLTTSRMHPALAARIEASVNGRRRANAGAEARRRSRSTLLIGLARLGAIVLVVAVTWAVVAARRTERRELEESRAALLGSVASTRAATTETDLATVGRVEGWLARGAEAYEGDLVAPEVRTAASLSAVLARPAIYVRGTLRQGAGGEREIAEAAAASLKDPLLVCLLEPPADRSEKTILSKVREAYGSDAEKHSPNVRRLRDAQIGLPFLLPPWGGKVEAAKTAEELDALRDLLAKAPIEGAKRALKATVLVFALDEPSEADAKTPTELDGERPHPVRIEVVDLAASKPLLRARKHVDPSWISAAKRPLYAAGIDGCAAAFDVREDVKR